MSPRIRIGGPIYCDRCDAKTMQRVGWLPSLGVWLARAGMLGFVLLMLGAFAAVAVGSDVVVALYGMLPWYFGVYFLSLFVLMVAEVVPSVRSYRCRRCGAGKSVRREKLSEVERIALGIFAGLIVAAMFLLAAVVLLFLVT